MRTLRNVTPVNAGSMADIAFLLLIFFFVTTTIQTDKGIILLLPQIPEDVPPAKIADRNLFKVLINSENAILVEGEIVMDIGALKSLAKEFIANPFQKPHLSVDPEQAIISLKTNRGSSYLTYIQVLDQLKGAYYEIYAEKAKISPAAFRALDLKNPKERKLYQLARTGIPMNISLAETHVP